VKDAFVADVDILFVGCAITALKDVPRAADEFPGKLDQSMIMTDF
jgi:3-keto-L-gulonate-6-phosphate decarboxylase